MTALHPDVSLAIEMQTPPRPVDVITRVASEHGMRYRELVGRQRTKFHVAARHDAALRLRMLGLSYPEIGAHLGGRDHTTILYILGELGRQRREAASG